MPTPPPSSRDDTYNDEMQRWMARQSWWYRLRYMRRHRGSRSLAVSLVMLAIKLVPVLVLGLVIYYLMLNRYLGSGADFSRLLEQEAAPALGAANVGVQVAKWKAGVVTVNELKGEGDPQSWIRRFTLTGLRFDQPFSKLFKAEWRPGVIAAQKLDLEIRAGQLGPEESAQVASAQEAAAARARQDLEEKNLDPGPYTGRYGVKLEGQAFAAERLLVRDANIRWGGNPESAGSLLGTSLEAARDGQSWMVRLTGGDLSHGWLRGTRLQELIARIGPDGVAIEKLAFRIPPPPGTQADDGLGSMVGVVTYGVQPQMEIRMKLQRVDLAQLLPEDLSHLFTGRASGEILMKGSTNRDGGMTTQGALEFSKGFSFGARAPETLPLLEVLGGEIAEIPLRYFDTAEGGVRYTLGGGKFKVDGVNLVSGDGDRVEGAFAMDLATRGISGVFRIGVRETLLASRDALRERYFREQSGGLRWLTVPVEGPLLGATSEIAEGIREVNQAANEP
jgi:hypothetical protein